MTDHYEEILDALAHEIWAAAQLAPGEGIVDGVDRIVALLRKGPHQAITHCGSCGCDWLDNGLNPVGCPYCKLRRETERELKEWIERNVEEPEALRAPIILRKQAEAVEAMAAELKGSSRYGKPGFNRGMATAYGFSTGYAHRLRQQADGLEAGKAGGES